MYEEPVRLNLGCGANYKLSWVNLDADPTVKADIHADLKDGLPFSNGYASEVLLSHVLEHMNYEVGRQLVSEVYRVLKKGGTFRVSTPNLDYVLTHEASDPLLQHGFILGNQTTEWQHHIALYTVPMLKRLLHKFESVTEEFVWHEIRLRAKK